MAIINGTDGDDVLNGTEGTSVTQRVSTAADGSQVNGMSINAFSSFGEFLREGDEEFTQIITFWSAADNLAPGDTNGALDVFVKVIPTNEVWLLSSNQFSVQSNGNSFAPDSTGGLLFAFGSEGSNLVPDDTNGVADVFIKNLRPEEAVPLIRVSTDSNGVQGNSNSNVPDFSPDGTKVTFSSNASNLVSGDTNGTTDVFVKDMNTNATTRVSTDSAGIEGNDVSTMSVFSPDGTKVAFLSLSSNLVTGDTNGAFDIFIKDLVTGVTTCASTDSAGIFGNAGIDTNDLPEFSPDSTRIAFASSASNLVLDDTNGETDVFIKDLITGAMTLVSRDSAGIQGNSLSNMPDFFPDGTKVIFSSFASNLVPGDANGETDIFVKDLVTGTVTLVSKDTAGTQGDSASYAPEFSPDGSQILFASSADNLVTGDTNGVQDLFLVSQAGADDTISGNFGKDTIHGGAGNDTITGDSGDDTLFGDLGDDRMSGGTGKDVMEGGLGRDWINGDTGNDIIHGGIGRDTLFGDDGNDVLFGDNDRDHMEGGKGEDILYGGADGDSLFGNTGNDTIYGSLGDDFPDGGDGNDTLFGDDGNDTFSGGRGNDVLHGGVGNDILFGDPGKDTLFGDDGDDSLNGGSGIDKLTGGVGSDAFVFDSDALLARDRITDFSLTGGDRLELHNILTGYSPLGSVITDFVRITSSDGDSKFFVDSNGNVDGQDFTQIALLYDVTGLTNEVQLLADGVLVVV